MRIIYSLIMLSMAIGSGCARRWTPLLDAEVVSMTKSSFSKSKAIGPVSSEYCFDTSEAENAETYRGGDADIGLVDEVIMRAQKEKKADAIKEVSIEQSGECVRLQGIAIRAK